MSLTHRRPATAESGGRGLVLALGLSAMIVSMMQTLVVPILTVVQKDLSLSSSSTSWLATSTLLSAAVFTPLLGRLGDMRGKRPVLLCVLGVTVVGSALAATTSSFPLLLLARAMQGASTAIFPLALSVLRDELPARRLPGAMGLVSGTLAFGSGLALVGAGLLTQGPHPDYHRVFWLATVLSLIALATVAFAVPPSPSSTGGRTDWLGATTLAGALVLLLLPISQGSGTWGWTSARCLGLLGGAAVLTAVWVVVERRVRQPLVDMRMFALRPVVFTNLAGVLLGFGMFTQFIGISYFVQTPHRIAGYGFSASVLDAAVVYLLPGTVASLIAAQFGGVLVRRIGARVTLAAGAGSGVLGFGWLAVSHGSSGGVVAAGLLTGIAVSFGFATLPAFIVAGVPVHQSGIANGINSIARSLGSSLGSAVITALLSARLLTGLPSGTPAVPAESQYTLSFALGATAFALVVLIALTGLRIEAVPHHKVVRPAGPGGQATEGIRPTPGPRHRARRNSGQR
ncbi:MFS transporter [Streptomyces sp. NRRL S-1824]|uniref:MFS transporter n=1 Tax=Streptomyces sp. NRRL S-1824 TaxID=1463889 RepID=UPI0007C44AB4|nr:MFS transporter [Streptomyces sp. NRRL S-1824]